MKAKLLNKKIEHINEYKISEKPITEFDVKTGKYNIILYSAIISSFINTIEEQEWIDVYDAVIGGKLLYKTTSDTYKHITNISVKLNYLQIETEEHIIIKDTETYQWFNAKMYINEKLDRLESYNYIERIKHIYNKISRYQNVYFFDKNFRIYSEEAKASLGMEQIIIDITSGNYNYKLTPLDKYAIFKDYKINLFKY